MEDKREYIEIDSTYRDRKLFPNPSDFIINVTDTGTTSDANVAINPLSEAYPIYNFQGPHPELLGIDKDFSGNDTQFLLGGTPQSRFGGTGSINQFNKFHELDNYLVPISFNTHDLSNLEKNSQFIILDQDKNPILFYTDNSSSSITYDLYASMRTKKSDQFGKGASIKFSPGINSYGTYTTNLGFTVKNTFQIGLNHNWGYIPNTNSDTFTTDYEMAYSFKIFNNRLYIHEGGINVGSEYVVRDTDMYQILYDGTNIIYYKNGTVIRTTATSDTTFGLSMKFIGVVNSKLQLTDYIAMNQFTNYQNVYNDAATNPWRLTTQIGNNNFGPGTKQIPHLDGVPISEIKNGAVSYENIENSGKTVYPEIYNYSFQSAKSYDKFPYASTVNNYYDGLNLCRYTSQDPSGQNPVEISRIDNYKGLNNTFKNEPTVKTLFYNKGRSIQSADIDTASTVFSNGPNSCNLENAFTDNWNATDYWGINCTSLLSVSNPQNVVIHGGKNIDDYYTGYYLEDCTMPLGKLRTDPSGSNPNQYIKLCEFENRFKKIISYDGKTRKALLTNDSDKLGFPICNYSTGYTHQLENNSYHLMNANPDRANSFKLQTGDSDLAYALGYQKSPQEFNENGQQYTWPGADASGAKGWIPQDRYRIRKELPLVMGWGFNEDRDGAHARIGGLTDNTDVEQTNLYTGTGPRNGKNGVVSKFEFINNGLEFGTFNEQKKIYEPDPNVVYGSGLPTQGNNNLDSHFYINIVRVEETTGSILEATIAWPGYDFKLDDEITIYNNGGNTNAIIKVTQIGQSIDISNGFKKGYGYTTGDLSTNSNQYNGELLYIPSKGPEKKSSQHVTKYNLTGYLKSNKPHTRGKDPPYIDQFPLELKLDGNSYENDENGIVPITTYITSKAKTLHIKKEADPSGIVNSSLSGIWKGSPGRFLYTHGANNTVTGITQDNIPSYASFITWNGGQDNNSINYGEGYLLLEDRWNFTDDDTTSPGIFFKHNLKSGSYRINLTAWRVKLTNARPQWAHQDISGNAVFSIQRSNGTYVTNLPNPYDQQGTMSLLPETIHLDGNDINKVQTINVTLAEDEYTFIVKFVGATTETTLVTSLDSSLIGGTPLNFNQNAYPQFYKNSNDIYSLYLANNTLNIQFLNNSGTTQIRYLDTSSNTITGNTVAISNFAITDLYMHLIGSRQTIIRPITQNSIEYMKFYTYNDITSVWSSISTSRLKGDIGNVYSTTTGCVPQDTIEDPNRTGYNNGIFIDNIDIYRLYYAETLDYAKINNEVVKVDRNTLLYKSTTTTLSGNITTTEPVNITLSSVSNIRPTNGNLIKINNEEILYTSYSGNVLNATGMIRGYNGTIPTTHSSGSTVSCKFISFSQRGVNSINFKGEQLISNQFLGNSTTLQLKSSVTSTSDLSGNTLPSSGTIRVGNEYITYTGKTRNTVTGITRGVNNTTLSTALPLAGYYDSNNYIQSWQYITLPNNTVRNQYGISEIFPYYYNENTNMPYLYVGAEKVSWRGASGELILGSGWYDPSGENEAWRLRRNLNRTSFSGYASNSEVIPALISGGDGNTSTTYNITPGSGNDFPQNYTNCHVRIGGEYLKITNITANTISLQREQPYTLAAAQSYSGTITQIVLSTNSGKRRGLQRDYTQGSDNTIQVDGPLFYISGGSNGSGGAAATRLIQGKCILVQDNNNNTETIIFKNPASIDLGNDTFNTSNTVISFCTQHLENALINTAIDHPVGTTISAQKIQSDSENVTTSIFHPVGSTITSTRVEDISTPGNANITGMTFMNTGVDVTLNYNENATTIKRSDLYVGTSTGGIIHYEYGQYDILNYEGLTDISNNWISKGYIQDSSNNQIDAGSDAYPAFGNMNNDGKMHLFIGSSNGNILYYENIGTNTSPIWKAPGIVVQDNNGAIAFTGITRPALANIRGYDPPRYDLFIGDDAGNITIYDNNGSGGPWSGSNSWPFVKNAYGNGYLTDSSCPKNPSEQPGPGSTYANLVLTNATDFSGNTTSAGTAGFNLGGTGRGSVTLWKNGSPANQFFYIAKDGNTLRIDKTSIPTKNIDFPPGSKITTKNTIGATMPVNAIMTSTEEDFLTAWSRGQIRVDNFEIIDLNSSLITENKDIFNFGQLSPTTTGRSWTNWTQSTGGKSITKEVVQDTSAIKITLNDFNNLAEGGYISYNLGVLAKGSYKLSIHAESSSKNTNVELYSMNSKDDYDHLSYRTTNFKKIIEENLQGAEDYGVINRGENFNGRIIHDSLSELKGKPFTPEKTCQQYTFQAYGRRFELRLGFNRDIDILRLNDNMTIYHVILTKEDVNADWIISNGYRDMSGVESDDNFFVDISGGQLPLERTGTVGVVVTSNGFNDPVTGNVSNGINSNTGLKEVYNFDLSGDAINFTGDIISAGTFASPEFFTDSSGVLQLFIGRRETGIIKYRNTGDAQNPDLRYDAYAPNNIGSLNFPDLIWSGQGFTNTSLTFGRSWRYISGGTSGIGDIVYIGVGLDSSYNSVNHDGKILYYNKQTDQDIWSTENSNFTNFVRASMSGQTTTGVLGNFVTSNTGSISNTYRNYISGNTIYQSGNWLGNSIFVNDGTQLVSNFTYERGFAMIDNERVHYERSVATNTTTTLLSSISETDNTMVFSDIILEIQNTGAHYSGKSGIVVKIDSEQIEIRTMNGATALFCNRGKNGSIAASHSAGAIVYISSMNHVERGYNAKDYNGHQLNVDGYFDRTQTTLNLKTTQTTNANLVSHTLPTASQGNPIIIRVGNEYISYTGQTNNSITGITRGLNNTTLGQGIDVGQAGYNNLSPVIPSEINLVSNAARNKFNPEEYYYIWIGAELWKFGGFSGDTGLVPESRGINNITPQKDSSDWGALLTGGDGTVLTYTYQAGTAFQNITDVNIRRSLLFPENIGTLYMGINHIESGGLSAEIVTVTAITGNQVSLKREEGFYRMLGDYDISGSIPSYIDLDVPDNDFHRCRGTAGKMIWSGGSIPIFPGEEAPSITLSYSNRVGNRFYFTNTPNLTYSYMKSGSPYSTPTRWTTGDTYISFCTSVTGRTNLPLVHRTYHAPGTPVVTSTGNWDLGRTGSNLLYDQLMVTTMIDHPEGTNVTTSFLATIDVSSNAVPALLDTGTTVDISPTNPNSNTPKVVPKYDLYVGNSEGNIRRFVFGSNDTIDYEIYFGTTSGDAVGDYTINWTDRGNITDSGGNLIDVGTDASPTFCKINNDAIYHMFVGNEAGYIKFFRNTGTNSEPIWQPGITVKDNQGFDIYSLGSAKPTLRNLRGTSNPALDDLFIGNRTGNIYYYFNDGTGGPWDGSTTSWPFKIVPYKNGFLADTGSETATFSGGATVPVNGYSRVGLRNSYNWEILRCSQDGVKSFKYLGDKSIININYQIKLVSITIPNQILKTGIGKRVTSNPYLYLELRNTNAAINNLIVSNNPNARNALFKISLKDIPDLENSIYCKLKGDNIVQTVKLNLSESLKFKLYFGDGTEVTTNINDNVPPLSADKDLQISAIFEIKKDQ